MTQQLQQSIQVLQYNSEELLAFVENQAMENPLVEVVEPEWQPDYIKASSSSYEGEETNYPNQIPDTKGSLFDSLIEQVHLNSPRYFFEENRSLSCRIHRFERIFDD